MNRHGKETRMALVVFLGLLSGCASIPRVGSTTSDSSLPGEGKPLFGGPKRDKVPPIEASAPARELDQSDPTGGRLTLVEMHRIAMERIKELEAALREKDQQEAALRMSNEEFRTHTAALTDSYRREKEAREHLEKEGLSLKAKLLEFAVKLAEAERAILQLKIAALKEKPARGPARKSSPAEPEKPAAGAESEPEKKEGDH